MKKKIARVNSGVIAVPTNEPVAGSDLPSVPPELALKAFLIDKEDNGPATPSSPSPTAPPSPPSTAPSDPPPAVPPSPSPVTQEFQLHEFLVDDSGPIEMRVDSEIELVRVRKPSNTKYVSIYPEKRCVWIVPEDRDTRREPYLVTPAIGKALMPLCRRAQLVAWVDPDGNYGIWPILLENSMGDINDFSLSAMSKVDIAIADGKWYSFRVPKGQRAYGLWEAVGELNPPKWPPGGIDFLIPIAFKDRTITNPNDPFIQALRGKLVQPKSK